MQKQPRMGGVGGSVGKGAELTLAGGLKVEGVLSGALVEAAHLGTGWSKKSMPVAHHMCLLNSCLSLASGSPHSSLVYPSRSPGLSSFLWRLLSTSWLPT